MRIVVSAEPPSSPVAPVESPPSREVDDAISAIAEPIIALPQRDDPLHPDFWDNGDVTPSRFWPAAAHLQDPTDPTNSEFWTIRDPKNPFFWQESPPANPFERDTEAVINISSDDGEGVDHRDEDSLSREDVAEIIALARQYREATIPGTERPNVLTQLENPRLRRTVIFHGEEAFVVLDHPTDKLLGTGHVKRVQLAKDENGKLWALGRISKRKNISTLDSIHRDLDNEVAFMRECAGADCIVQLKCYAESPRAYYVLSEYCTGGDFFDLLDPDKEELEFNDMVFMMLRIAIGVAQLHEKNIWHRDIKRENVFLNEDGPKIGDLGLSCHHDDPVLKNIVRGTLKYFSPEELWAWNKKLPMQDINSRKSEIWQLGILFFSFLRQDIEFDQIFNIEKFTPVVNAAPADQTYDQFFRSITPDTTPKIFTRLWNHLQNELPRDELLPLSELVLGMLNPDPQKRLSIVTVIDQLSALYVPPEEHDTATP